MTWSIRLLEDRDWDAVAALIDAYEHDGYTGQHLREMAQRADPGDPNLRLVAVADGEVVACGRSGRRACDPPGKFMAGVHVAAEVTGRGIGRELADRLEAFARERGGAYTDSFVNDRCDRGAAFAKLRGGKELQHLFESNLSLAGLDLGPHLTRKADLEREGYYFRTLAEAGDTDENRRRIHALDILADKDTPGFENWGPRTYEQYSRDEHQSAGFTADGVFVAEFDAQWIAMNAVRPTPVPGKFHTDFTGVVREHRGKGIALVLKALGIGFAQSQGAHTMQTHNDDRNAPMLAINQRLGFVPEPGFVVYRKHL